MSDYLIPNSFRVLYTGRFNGPASNVWECVFDYCSLEGDSPLITNLQCDTLAASWATTDFHYALLACIGENITVERISIAAVAADGTPLEGAFVYGVPQQGTWPASPLCSFGDCSLIWRYTAESSRAGRGRVRLPFVYVTSFDNLLNPAFFSQLGVFSAYMLDDFTVAGVVFTAVLIGRSSGIASPVERVGVRSRAYHLRTRTRPHT